METTDVLCTSVKVIAMPARPERAGNEAAICSIAGIFVNDLFALLHHIFAAV